MAEASTMSSSYPQGPSLACSAVGQYWMNSKTWIAKPTDIAQNVTKHWHYLRDYRVMTIGMDIKAQGSAWGCHYNTLEVRGSVSLSVALNNSPNNKQDTLIVERGKDISMRFLQMSASSPSTLDTHPICRFVEGAWVMTELDWGDGRACWITMLVSWLPIREWACWCWPWPAWLCSVMFCRGTQQKVFKVRKLSGVSHSFQQLAVSSQQHYSCLALSAIPHWIMRNYINYHLQVSPVWRGIINTTFSILT